MSKTRWVHQVKGVNETIAAIDSGERAICLTSPTGGGKSLMAQDLIADATARGWRSILYSNRVMLTTQLSRDLTAANIPHGIRAAGHDEDWERPVQIASMQTEDSRIYRREQWDRYPAKLVLVDEAHNQKGGVAQRIIQSHLDAGAVVVGLTATPLGIGDIYSRIVVAGVNSELRRCGALVPCYTYAPDEPDCRDLKPTKTGEFVEGDVVKAIMTPTIFARVLENWKTLNPDGRPTILFAPGVGESIWFAEQFHAAGVTVAHIDGQDIWRDGRSHTSTQAGRDEIIEDSKSGRIRVICNRFVLREGIDLPWLYHGIFATAFGALTSYLQSGGRLLRAHPTLDHVRLQDHGGNWWRHGSLNADRHWELSADNRTVAEARVESMREKKEPEPICCPRCHAVRLAGPTCQACGHEHHRKSRMVVQRDGSLRQMFGDIVKPRKVALLPDTAKLWENCFWRIKKSQGTFKQAEALFFQEHRYYPPRDLPLMPKEAGDWSRQVKDTPFAKLNSKPAKAVEQPLFEGASA